MAASLEHSGTPRKTAGKRPVSFSDMKKPAGTSSAPRRRTSPSHAAKSKPEPVPYPVATQETSSRHDRTTKHRTPHNSHHVPYHEQRNYFMWFVALSLVIIAGYGIFQVFYRATISFNLQTNQLPVSATIAAVRQYQTGQLPYYAVTVTQARSALIPDGSSETDLAVINQNLTTQILDMPTLYDRMRSDIPSLTVTYPGLLMRGPLTTTTDTTQPEGPIMSVHQDVTLIFFKKAELEKYLVTRYVATDYPMHIVNWGTFSFDLDSSALFVHASQIPDTVPVHLTGELHTQASTDTTAIATKNIHVSREICLKNLQNVPGITAPSCAIFPLWKSKTPHNSGLIHIQIPNLQKV